MKSNSTPPAAAANAWARPVGAAPTPAVPTLPPQQPGESSSISAALGLLPDRASPQAVRPARPTPMRLTDRDRAIINLVFQARAVRTDQVQAALFTPGALTRCQLRLTLLYRNRYLDRLPRRSVNEPAVYVLSRRSTHGNRLLRERWGDAAFRRGLGRLGPVAHLLAINDVRVRIQRACADLGWSLQQWQSSAELGPKLSSVGLIPDAYLQIQRQAQGQARTAAFFLEVERAAKSSHVLREKLQHYGELYYSGRYQDLFGTRALRVLVVFDAEGEAATQHRIQVGAAEAQRLGVTIARFAGLDHLKAVSPIAALTTPLWQEPGSAERVALFTGLAPAPAVGKAAPP